MPSNREPFSLKNIEALEVIKEMMSEPLGYYDLDEKTRQLISKEEFNKMPEEKRQEVIDQDTRAFVEYINSCRFSLGTEQSSDI